MTKSSKDTKDSIRTVGCAFNKLVPSPEHRNAIIKAVHITHRSTVVLTELLNMHVRRMLSASQSADLACVFNSNWIKQAYNLVTNGSDRAYVDKELSITLQECMPSFTPYSRSGLGQCLCYEAINLAAVASNNVWMHFTKRVHIFVKQRHALGDDAYRALDKVERRRRRLTLMQVASDICRAPDAQRASSASWHAEVQTLRAEIGIDTAVGSWDNKPLLYHLKERPHRFLRAMAHMSAYIESSGGRAFALFPLRRANVPRHVRFDQLALRQVLALGGSEHTKNKQTEARKARREGKASSTSDQSEPVKRVRRSKDDMYEEKHSLFSSVVDLKAADVQQAHRFDFAFTTDGVCARVQMRKAVSSSKRKRSEVEPSAPPRREFWTIDTFKNEQRLGDLHVIGVDPGKAELIVGVDMDDPKNSTPVRYTMKQRQRDRRSVQYAREAETGKPEIVKQAFAKLAGFSSRTSDLERFCAFCAKRHETLEEVWKFYMGPAHRKRRWKTYIKTQQSEQRLYERLQTLHEPDDKRTLVLAYGSWGLVAGRPGTACNRGTPPCVGVGLMRKLAQRFTVVLTPEAYTSKTCCKCLGACGPWKEKEEEMGYKIRGLRRCQNEECILPVNRDKNGATNIGTQFMRLMRGQGPIRAMTDEDLEFHRAALCFECED